MEQKAKRNHSSDSTRPIKSTHVLQFDEEFLLVLLDRVHRELVVVDDVARDVELPGVVLRSREVDPVLRLHVLQVRQDVLAQVVKDARVRVHRHVVQRVSPVVQSCQENIQICKSCSHVTKLFC